MKSTGPYSIIISLKAQVDNLISICRHWVSVNTHYSNMVSESDHLKINIKFSKMHWKFCKYFWNFFLGYLEYQTHRVAMAREKISMSGRVGDLYQVREFLNHCSKSVNIQGIVS